MTSQLERWQGEFGRAYTDRNQVDWRTRVKTFGWIVPAGTRSVLEVGTNSGHNLLALSESFPGARLVGAEPARYARRQARKQGLRVQDWSIYDLYAHRRRYSCDLVFTSGVLIHVPPDRLREALTNVYLVARRYILAIEYHANEDKAVSYRGQKDMLWKRDYGAHYLRVFPELRLVSSGDLSEADGFADSRYWLLAK